MLLWRWSNIRGGVHIQPTSCISRYAAMMLILMEIAVFGAGALIIGSTLSWL
jgi:hypothetical protein